MLSLSHSNCSLDLLDVDSDSVHDTNRLTVVRMRSGKTTHTSTAEITVSNRDTIDYPIADTEL